MTPSGWQRVEELYHAALGRAPAEREAFLAAECGSDQALLREVRSLLAHAGEAERLLEEPAVAAGTEKLALRTGTRLGPYQILGLVGAGGMGEVYRARDTRLGRDVAIKVLPELAAHDRDALSRFGREARAVAALNHPHIATLFDIGEHEGTHYLVMELLEGETLAARVARGFLKEKDALRIGAEIAEALAAAHRQGVVHRDVKPANIVLTPTGAKLLDFGLARLQRPPGPLDATTTATNSLAAGVPAGTLPYMAPEQLEARDVDARTDIWALGCVLFEMFAGRRAFDGNSQAGVIAAIEKDDAPSIVRHRATTSPALDRLVRQCLKTDPAERWQSAADVALRLREISEPETDERSRPRIPRKLRIAAIAGGSLVFLLAGVVADRLWLRAPGRSHTGPSVRSYLDLPAEAAPVHFMPPELLPSTALTQLAVNRDGTRLVWAGSPDGSTEKAALHVQSLDGGEVRRIAGTDGARQPFFSPDGRWIAFFAKGKLRKVPTEGGPVVALAETRSRAGAWWAPDGRIFLGASFDDRGLEWVSSEGGVPQGLTRPDRTRESGHRLPSVLPGGRAVLFTTMSHGFGVLARVEALSLTSGERKIVIEDCADGRYLSTGHLVCLRQGALVAASFDVGRLELTGPVVPVVEGVLQDLNVNWSSGAGQLAVSESGLLVYVPGGIYEDLPNELVLVDATGRTERLPGFDKPLVVAGSARFSPDGHSIAFAERARSGKLWLFDVDRRTHRSLTRDGIGGFPQWSPDGSRLVVNWSRAGPLNLWSVPLEGGSEWTRLTDNASWDWPASWSPDGRVLAFVRGGDVLLYRFEDHQVVPFLASNGAREWHPDFSPDGRWLAYVSNEGGRQEVYVSSFPDRKQTLVVSRDGGDAPVWSRDGRRLFYVSPIINATRLRTMMEVAVRPGDRLALGQPRTLFPMPRTFLINPQTRGFTLHPDGRRFLFTRTAEREPRPPVTRFNLVHNWFAELERLSPTRP